MNGLRFDGARVMPGCRKPVVPLVDDATGLLDRLRAYPLPEEPRNAAALRRATQAAFAILQHTRALAERQAREPKETP